MSDGERPLGDRLRQHRAYLLDKLKVSDYLDDLYRVNVLCDQDKDDLTVLRGRWREQAERFVDIMMDKSKTSIRMFFELVRTKQPQIYERLFPKPSPTLQQEETSKRRDHCTIGVACKEYGNSEAIGTHKFRGDAVEKTPRVRREAARSRQPAFTYLECPGGEPSTASASPNVGSAEQAMASFRGPETTVFPCTARKQKQSHGGCPSDRSTQGDGSLIFYKPNHCDFMKSVENGISFCSGMSTVYPASTDANETAAVSSVPMTVPTSCNQSSVDETTKGATFYFREEDREAVKPLENLIRQMCHEWFRILEEDVVFLYIDERRGLGYPFHGDLKSKHGVFQLFGVEPYLVMKHRTRLVHCVADFLRTKPDLVHFM